MCVKEENKFWSIKFFSVMQGGKVKKRGRPRDQLNYTDTITKGKWIKQYEYSYITIQTVNMKSCKEKINYLNIMIQ